MPLLPLDTWRKILGYNPYHFFGLANTSVPVTSACNGIVTQYAWQAANQAGRDDILNAIQKAEDMLRDWLGYSVAPRYTEATVSWPRYQDHNTWRGGYGGADGRYAGVRLPEGKIRSLGIESRTLLATVAVVYSDENGDGVTDTFTLTTPAAGVSLTSEVAVYFQSSDRMDGEAVSDKYRVLPVTVSISGGNIIVKGRSYLLVRPLIYEGVDDKLQGINPDSTGLADNLFAQSLEVYQRKTNGDGQALDTAQATLLWETVPCDGWWCWGVNATFSPTDSRFDPGAVGLAIARVGIRDAELGWVLPAQAIYNSTSGLWHASGWELMWREPDRVIVRYLAGEALQADGQMQSRWQTIVARLAAAELGGRICACDEANAELHQWQFDLSRAAGANDEQYSISPADLDNPFGTRRGQAWAWKQVKKLARQTAAIA